MLVKSAPPASEIAGIILAGGRSSRMGRDKALLALPSDASQTFVERLTSLLAGLCAEVFLVARPGESGSEKDAFPADSRRQVVYDLVPDQGPLMGLYSGLRAISCSHALVLAVDQPFVHPALLAWLHAFPRDERMVIPRVQDIPQVLLARYPRALLPVIEECLRTGRRDPRALLHSGVPLYFWEEEDIRAIDPDLRSFVNVNTPEDFQRAISLLT